MQDEVQSKPSFGKRFAAGAKEFFRKSIVSLKRKPQTIPLVFTLIASVCYLLWLRTFSIAVTSNFAANWIGFCVFVNILLSVLVLALFLSAFPKRKKPNYVLIGAIFAFYAIMIVCDIIYHVLLTNYLSGRDISAESAASLTYTIVHIVLLGICIIVLAALPLYKKLILKINTQKEVSSNEITEVIETEDE